jgi:hypothetical protein
VQRAATARKDATNPDPTVYVKFHAGDNYRTHQGSAEKVCTSVLHCDGTVTGAVTGKTYPGTWLPLVSFGSRTKHGKIVTRTECRRCAVAIATANQKGRSLKRRTRVQNFDLLFLIRVCSACHRI